MFEIDAGVTGALVGDEILDEATAVDKGVEEYPEVGEMCLGLEEVGGYKDENNDQ